MAALNAFVKKKVGVAPKSAANDTSDTADTSDTSTSTSAGADTSTSSSSSTASPLAAKKKPQGAKAPGASPLAKWAAMRK